MKRESSEGVFLTPMTDRYNVCPVVISRTFGFSVHVLINCLNGRITQTPIFREWYSKTRDAISSSLAVLAKHVQFNSLNQIMLPPHFSARLVSEVDQVPVKVLRKKMNVNLRERKSDTLTRCSVCTSLREIMKSGDSEDLRNKSKRDLEAHYSYISQQRIIMETLSKQSRDPDSDVLVILSDSMSNKYSKLPILLSRPKNISDAIRVPMSLTTFQFALQNGTHMFTNFDYTLHQTLYKHDGSFTFSLLLDVFVLFPQVGHTHLSVDSHFGTVSTHLKETNVYDPKELSETLKTIPSVFDVVSDPTIFDFSRLNEEVNKIPGLCSTNQIVISRSADGSIYVSSAPSINSSILFETSSKEKATKLFKDSFDPLKFFPTFQIRSTDPVRKAVDNLLTVGGSMFSPQHADNFDRSISQYGKKSFGQIVMILNRKARKTQSPLHSTTDNEHMTIVNHLKRKGYGVGHLPKQPKFD